MVLDWIDLFAKGLGSACSLLSKYYAQFFVDSWRQSNILEVFFFTTLSPCKVETTTTTGTERGMTRLSCNSTERRFACLCSSLDEDTEKQCVVKKGRSVKDEEMRGRRKEKGMRERERQSADGEDQRRNINKEKGSGSTDDTKTSKVELLNIARRNFTRKPWATSAA